MAFLMCRTCELELYFFPRSPYRPNMASPTISVPPLSPLCSDLYAHLEKHEVSPMLYATPWFLTLFSSQYPIGFAARVFGESLRDHSAGL